MHYLIVDDEMAICQGTAQRLRRFLPEGESIVCMFSGEDALDYIRNQPVDVLITDIRMGEMDGLNLIEQAREYKPNLACIMITAYDVFKYAQQAIKLEVKDFLVKPYGEAELREAVERVTAGLKKTQNQQTALLEKHIQETLQDEEKALEKSLFIRAGRKEPPECFRLVAWDRQESKMPAWGGEWSYCDLNRHCLLIEDNRDAVLEWVQRPEAAEVHFGISLPGTKPGVLWKQAQEALCISAYDSTMHWVFYQEAFSDERSFKQDHIVLWAMNYVAGHVGQPISMEDVCNELHVNYTYFSRQFKQQTGLSFSAYLLKSKMQWALEEMKKGMRVNEAADALGYGGADSFCKAFIRVFGCAPRQYLKQQRQEKKE